MSEIKEYSLMVLRLPGDDRNWVRQQARLLEKVTGTCSESAVIQMIVRTLREGIAEGTIKWDVNKGLRASDGC
jgi:hypothetical protein